MTAPGGCPRLGNVMGWHTDERVMGEIRVYWGEWSVNGWSTVAEAGRCKRGRLGARFGGGGGEDDDGTNQL